MTTVEQTRKGVCYQEESDQVLQSRLVTAQLLVSFHGCYYHRVWGQAGSRCSCWMPVWSGQREQRMIIKACHAKAIPCHVMMRKASTLQNGHEARTPPCSSSMAFSRSKAHVILGDQMQITTRNLQSLRLVCSLLHSLALIRFEPSILDFCRRLSHPTCRIIPLPAFEGAKPRLADQKWRERQEEEEKTGNQRRQR